MAEQVEAGSLVQLEALLSDEPQRVLNAYFVQRARFEAKLGIQWVVDIPTKDVVGGDFPMTFAPVQVSRTSVKPFTPAGLVEVFKQQVNDRLESSSGAGSEISFIYLAWITLLMTPSKELQNLGAGWVDLPLRLHSKHAVVNIRNLDNQCFRCCTIYHRERAQGYTDPPPPGHRPT